MQVLSWSHDGKNTDGSPFTVDQFAGFQLSINDEPAVSIPAAWNDNGKYSMLIADVAALQSTGTKRVSMAVVNKIGAVSSPSNEVVFTMDFRTPSRPFGLSVSQSASAS